MNQQTRDQILARAEKDPAFKKKLLGSPAKVLKECGVDVPDGALSEAELDQVSGGIIAILIGRSGGNTER